ncbi:PaaI family thioesterase [Streptomyces arenae]|uniref:PaaI family thioesterase n=1 Tax=Streptomyces arenae TaxID=29301 RepID=UPI00265B61D1|nr:PaaI family thioesterase [Streptomyces arenae]MCG7207396.1 PaaI family thioesterase [Streptomyces arenae]
MTEPERGLESTPPPHGGDRDKWIAWANEMPASQAMQLRCEDIEPGRAVLVLDRGPWPLNPNGAIHGGLVAACADHVMAIALIPMLEPGSMPATATLNSDFLRPALPPVTFEAVVDKCGRTMGFLTVTARDRNGKLAAKCHGTMPVDGSSRFLDDTPA